MKILSWVHRKFNKNVLKVSNYGDAKKDEIWRKSSETKVLPKQISLVDMHDGWKDGILSIGTLGFEDPFEPFKQESQEFTFLSEQLQKQDDHDHDDQYFSNEYDFCAGIDSVGQDDQLDQLLIHSSEYVPKQDMQGTKPDEVRDFNAASLNTSSTEGDVEKQGDHRVTLADLFMADSKKKKIKDDHCEQEISKNASVTRKNTKSFVKKLVFGGKEHSIMKFQKLVKRMLKKNKIHPEFGGKNEKIVMFKPCASTQLLNEEEVEVSESISLLGIQGFYIHPEV